MECEICYSHKQDNDFVKLPCNHSLCNICFPKLINGCCPFCRYKFSNTNERYYNEVDQEFDLEFEVLYYSEEDDIPLSSRQRRRRRRNYNHTINSRPRNISNNTPTQIFIFEESNNQIIEPQRIFHNTKSKRVFKNNEKRRNKKNNTWNQLRLQNNISNSY